MGDNTDSFSIGAINCLRSNQHDLQCKKKYQTEQLPKP